MTLKDKIRKENIANTLSELWAPLEERQRTTIVENLTLRRYDKNDIIYKEHESPRNMKCLVSGKVKIYKDGVGGRPQIVRAIKPFELFAYRAFFAEEDYKTAAKAFEPSIVAFLPLDVLVNLMSENACISMYFIKQLSTMLGLSDDRTVNLTQKHIRGRLAEALLFLRDNYGIEEDGRTLSTYMSREDLANLSNMTTSNAIRTLSAFANEQLIAIDGKKIKLMNMEEIHRISNIG